MSLPSNADAIAKESASSTFSRVAKYAVVRVILLFMTVVVAVYLTIIVANLGGYVDEIMRGRIAEAIAGMRMGGWLDDVPAEQRNEIIEQTVQSMEESYGLHQPFMLRCVRWLVHGLTLNLGETELWSFFRGVLGSGNQKVQSLVLERLPFTLLLVGASNLLLFFASVFVSLFLSRKYGGLMDRIMVALAALNSAPSWIYGVLLIVILAGNLRILPFPKSLDMRYAELTPDFVRLLLKQMILPVAAIVLSVFFQAVYAWRTFFLLYAREDYVEMAQAMGLAARVIERRYILRPALPYVITNFALVMISLWEGAIALELLFYWPGIGRLFFQAIGSFNTELIVAVVVVFAYLLAITVFLLDLIYSLVDPRVRVGSGHQKTKATRKKGKSLRLGLQGMFAAMRGKGQTGGKVSSPRSERTKIPLSQRLKALGQRTTSALKSTLREVARYPSAIVGFVIIAALIGVAIHTVIAIPYDKAVMLWRTHSTDQGKYARHQNPKNAMPVWVNVFRKEKLPETLVMSSHDDSVHKNHTAIGQDMTDITFSFTYDYPYNHFPDELSLFFDSQFEEKKPYVSLTWLTPDGREIGLGSLSLQRSQVYHLSQDDRLQRKLGGRPVVEALFAHPKAEKPVPLKGRYELEVSSIVFENGADIDMEAVLQGRVFGLAGTDHHRRDLMVALRWGAPIALAFGLLGAIVTSLAAMLISAVGAWFGGWVDDVIQRITEVNIILPSLLVAIMVYIMYSKSIWAILGVIVLLNIFGSAIKNYRAAFLQVKEAAYIEGARAYGASDWRIILRYLIPRIVPVLIPQLVIMVPGYVFYEATLAYLGVSDPYLPTWGKVVYDALSNGALIQGHYYWILEPIGLLLLTGLAFALFGFALDRIFNPRLREM